MNKQHYIKNFSKIQFESLIEKLNGYPDCELVSYKLNSDGGHFNSYKYRSANGRFALHHDTKADILQLNADEVTLAHLTELADMLKGGNASGVHEAAKPQERQAGSNPDTLPVKPKAVKKQKSVKPPAGENKDVNAPQKNIHTAQKQKQPKIKEKIPEPEYKDGYALKDYPSERLSEALAALKKEGGVTVGKPSEFNVSESNHLIRYAVKDNKNNKINIQYTVKSKTIQIQGKRSDLFTKAQIVITNESHDLNSAVKAYIDYSENEDKLSGESMPDNNTNTLPKQNPPKVNNPQNQKEQKKPAPVKHDKTTKAVLKSLKSKIPNAFDYLTESEKAQLTFTMIDLDSNVKNFSGVLLPAYITLEQIIASLQKKEGIIVKMIGQAFEKENDKYILKQSYVKRLNSVVYPEVLLALYNEYNKRHKYVHTNQISGMMNLLDKAQASEVFEEMLRVVNYNFKKLIEIRYFDTAEKKTNNKGNN